MEMSMEERRKYIDAIDIVCDHCYHGDDDYCDLCPVYLTAERKLFKGGNGND